MIIARIGRAVVASSLALLTSDDPSSITADSTGMRAIIMNCRPAHRSASRAHPIMTPDAVNSSILPYSANPENATNAGGAIHHSLSLTNLVILRLAAGGARGLLV